MEPIYFHTLLFTISCFVIYLGFIWITLQLYVLLVP